MEKSLEYILNNLQSTQSKIDRRLAVTTVVGGVLLFTHHKKIKALTNEIDTLKKEKGEPQCD